MSIKASNPIYLEPDLDGEETKLRLITYPASYFPIWKGDIIWSLIYKE
jgi:hypothetical protein